MAIIFTSAKRKKRMFFWAITMLFILVLFVISFVAFLPDKYESTDVAKKETQKEEIKINFNVVDSDLVENLEPFLRIKTEFSYAAKDEKGRNVAGKISAVGMDEARDFLERAGLKILDLKEANIGRSEPFIIYY